MTTASRAKAHFGKPGTMRKLATARPAMTSARGCARSWRAIWPASCLSPPSALPTRVITMPAATDASSDGICDTMPSPTVRIA